MSELNELSNNIDRVDQAYFNGGSRPVDDSVYDGWKRRLKELCPTDERLTRVGAPIDNAGVGKKALHVHPMGSLDNAMNEEEFLKWAAGHPEGTLYNASFKMDGGSAGLVYKEGYLNQGITRGDGSEGEDITANALRMQGVPRYVEITTGEQAAAKGGKFKDIVAPFTGSVRGEVMLYNEDWKALDPDQLSNPRNLGNGMSRRHDGEDTERLRFVVFRGFSSDGKPLGAKESDMLSILRSMGFSSVPSSSHCTVQQVLSIYEAMQGGEWDMDIMPETWVPRDALPFEIDGLVVKIEDLELQESLGTTNNRPKGQIAFKFPPRGADTFLTGVDWTVGHTGALIPTGIVMPRKVGGVTVSRALLCNMEEIARLDVAVYDAVRVIRAGDVIPKIVEVIVRTDNRKPIEAPAECPVCSGKVGKKKGVKGDDGVHLFCLNPDCGAKQLGKIKTWVKKLDIQGLGDVFLEALVEKGALKDVSDIYRLAEPAKWLVLRDVLGDARAVKVLKEIDKKKELSLSDFLGSLGIDGLGRRRVILVQQAAPGEFDSLSDWCNGKMVGMAPEIGLPNTAEKIHDGIMAVRGLIDGLLEAGVTVREEKTMENEEPKAGQLCFVLTGKFPQPKAWYHDKILAAGHRYEDSYKKGISYLVSASEDSTSSKAKKASKDGVPMLTEAQLLEMLK